MPLAQGEGCCQGLGLLAELGGGSSSPWPGWSMFPQPPHTPARRVRSAKCLLLGRAPPNQQLFHLEGKEKGSHPQASQAGPAWGDGGHTQDPLRAPWGPSPPATPSAPYWPGTRIPILVPAGLGLGLSPGRTQPSPAFPPCFQAQQQNSIRHQPPSLAQSSQFRSAAGRGYAGEAAGRMQVTGMRISAPREGILQPPPGCGTPTAPAAPPLCHPSSDTGRDCHGTSSATAFRAAAAAARGAFRGRGVPTRPPTHPPSTPAP